MKIKDIQLKNWWVSFPNSLIISYGWSYIANGYTHRNNDDASYTSFCNKYTQYCIKDRMHNLSNSSKARPENFFGYYLYGKNYRNESDYELAKLKLMTLKVID